MAKRRRAPLPPKVPKSKLVSTVDGYKLWTEDELFCLRAAGPVTSAVVDALLAHLQTLCAAHPHYYILGDLLDAGSISPELRRRLVEIIAARPPQAVAFYRVSFVAHGINALLLATLNVLTRRKLPFKQFATEAEARGWLKSQRPRGTEPAS